MKTIKILTLLLITNLTFSQTIVELGDIEDADFPPQENKYYKDNSNLLNPFVGTYLYTNGNTSFKITLEKMVNSNINNLYYEDLLIGAYRYVENGIEKVNVLNDLDNNFTNGAFYKISGNDIMRGNELGQTGALPNEVWVILSIKDPVSNKSCRMFVKRTMVSNQEAVKINIYYPHGAIHENDPDPLPISFPNAQEFILIKQ